MNQLQIYKDAQRLFHQYGTRDPLEIIEAAPSIKLWPTDAFGTDGLKGFSTLSNQTYYVAVNSYLSIEEMRVVAGHELGHIFEHALQLRCQTMQDFDVYQAKGKLEREANFFAADLMLDDEKVLDLIYSGNTDFFDVAKALNIPAPFLGFKLYSLIGRGECSPLERGLSCYHLNMVSLHTARNPMLLLQWNESCSYSSLQ